MLFITIITIHTLSKHLFMRLGKIVSFNAFFYGFNYWHHIDLENYFFFFFKSGNQGEKFMHNRGIISFTL